MKKMFFKSLKMALAAVFLFALLSCGKTGTFELKSTAFNNGERIPGKYYYGAERENLSLPFNWVNPPAGTKSFALFIYNHNSRVNWAVFNIPANCTSIAENASSRNMPAGSVEVAGISRKIGYSGMEPPGQKTQTHQYYAVLYALNTDAITIAEPDVYKSLPDLKSILDGKIIAQAEINGFAQVE